MFVCLFRTSAIGIVFYGYITCNNVMSDMVIHEIGTESTIDIMYPLPKYDR